MKPSVRSSAAPRRRLLWWTMLLTMLGLNVATPGSAQPVGSFGRVRPTDSADAPARSICDAARDARARNSPAAPNLEAQCAAQQPVRSFGRVTVPPEPRVPETRQDPAIGGRDRPDSAIADRVPMRLMVVPNVIGMKLSDARAAVSNAGYEVKETYADEPDPSIGYGRIAATMPEAGRQQNGGEVELVVPRAASLVATGRLSVKDFDRRDGFDLDTMRYEQITHGADIVLVKRDSHPTIEPSDGHTYYTGGGTFVEVSDGAVMVDLGGSGNVQGGLGSYINYSACQYALRTQSPLRGFEIEHLHSPRSQIALCVRTSKGQLAVVTFSEEDNPGGTTDFKFYGALFPRQIQTLTNRLEETRPAAAAVDPH